MAPAVPSNVFCSTNVALTSYRSTMYRSTMTFMSRPPVAVFQPHHVVDLRRRGLEQVARRHCLELVDQLGLDVERRPLGHGPLDQRFALLNAQDDLAGQHVNRFVLLVVVLQRQNVSRFDVQDFADVPVGPGPDQLVAPRLLYAVGEGGHETLNCGLAIADCGLAERVSRRTTSPCEIRNPKSTI